ncbi:MAG: asparagine synthase (glutamine-hydrolyzing) [Flavobacteriales bacterium]|nr:asparagine synthase (glutamine-hydrolyzing) [Flavobacteriales bacterium]
MCGIAAVINATGTNEQARTGMENMLSAIRHRGPDASHIWQHEGTLLGHNRLSIIDLSDAADQPMHFAHLSIVFNGEVYNYREIRIELEGLGHTFHTGSDTEVVLHAYHQWGRKCVEKFMGMWALVIWDNQKQLAYLSRDRFGIKPLYYRLSGQTLVVASEIKALKKWPLWDGALNERQVLRGLQMGWTGWDDETYYHEVKSLPAAHDAEFAAGKMNVSCYWHLSASQTIPTNYDERVGVFRQLFFDSLKLHMRSDVEVGSCLSGGLDSSAIVSGIMSAGLHDRLKTFSIYYTGSDAVDERPWIKYVLDKYTRVQSFTSEPSADLLEEAFVRAQYHLDAPLPGSSPISQYFVMKLASEQGIKVVLDGQGSDEYLGGYAHSFYRLIGGQMARMKAGSALTEWRRHGRIQGFGLGKQVDVLLKSLFAGMRNEYALYRTEYLHYLPLLAEEKEIPFYWKDETTSRLNSFLYQLLFHTSLPTLLHFEDRNSMAWSIESRVPFLDHRLVEFVYACPDADKIKHGRTKRLLRDGLSGVLPDAIRDRTDKKGFVTPGEIRWLRAGLSRLLNADRVKSLPFIHSGRVDEVLDGFRKGNNRYAALAWRIMALNEWLRQQ